MRIHNNDPSAAATITKQLWNIANTLRGTMGADEFLDYILGFIFYKYLSEKAIAFADDILEGEDIQFLELDKSNAEYTQYIDVIKQSSIEEVSYPNFITACVE